MAISISDYIIQSTANARAALQQLNDLSSRLSRVLFVINEGGKLLGTITDGDIRRGLLSGHEISEMVTLYMNKQFRSVFSHSLKQGDIKSYKESSVDLLPVLHADGSIESILDLKAYQTIIPASAFIMAGGRGERLRPLTDTIPKPLLRVGDKPILEHNMDRLMRYGIEEFYISIRYLGDAIRQYFGDGRRKGIRIHYVDELQPLGTAGALSLADTFENDTILLMNSDLLTTLDFADFYEHFLSTDADISAASIPYTVNVPYGVFELGDQHDVVSLKEKPVYTYYSNAGIYLLKRSMIELIPSQKLYNATDLITDGIKHQKKVVNFPILGYWLDIGKQEDFLKAQLDIKHLDL
jgi:dTDP-glucose pyrophosphorylase